MIKYTYPAFIILGLLALIACASSNEPNGKIVEGTSFNRYEIVQVGEYTCVGMDGYQSGGIWCERTKK